MKRKLRRAALLLFPHKVLNEQTLDCIVDEGFDDVGVGVAVTPTTKGQGFDFEQSQQLAEMCEARGLGFIAFTAYMKYQQELLKREPSRMMRIAGQGKVADLDGMPVQWLCPFQPDNQSRYAELLMRLCDWPALREVHLNDEAALGFHGGRIGCYCDYCQDAFKQKTGNMPPLEADWDSELWHSWIQHRIDNWTQMHAMFRKQVKNRRPEIAVGVQHSPYAPERIYNAWESAICLAREAQEQDLLATDPYHFNHSDGIAHRPHRRILSETTRSLVGACVDKQVDIYPQGFMPPGHAVPMGRADGILAGVVPFALGADLVIPYTYELMKIIPGYFDGFDESKKLLPAMQKHRPYAFTTVLMPQQSEILGHPDGSWGATGLQPIVDTLHRTGLAWRWFWDQRLDDVGDQLAGPIILPETHCLTTSQRTCIDHAIAIGGGLWIGNTPVEDWSGRGRCPLPQPIQQGVFELQVAGEHPALKNMQVPIVLSSRVAKPPFDGQVLAQFEGDPALVIRDEAGRREAWLAGMPVVGHYGGSAFGELEEPTFNRQLIRNLLLWLAGDQPIVWLSPYPPNDAYRQLRPTDPRAVPTLELLPMVNEGQTSLLAIIMPYTPVSATTTLHVGRPITAAKELWRQEDWCDRVTIDANGESQIDLSIPGDCDLLAIQLTVT